MSSKMINFRLGAEDLATLEEYLTKANDRLESMGLPRDITTSGVIRRWVMERLAKEREPQEASHINAALEKLRAAR